MLKDNLSLNCQKTSNTSQTSFIRTAWSLLKCVRIVKDSCGIIVNRKGYRRGCQEVCSDCEAYGLTRYVGLPSFSALRLCVGPVQSRHHYKLIFNRIGHVASSNCSRMIFNRIGNVPSSNCSRVIFNRIGNVPSSNCLRMIFNRIGNVPSSNCLRMILTGSVT